MDVGCVGVRNRRVCFGLLEFLKRGENGARWSFLRFGANGGRGREPNGAGACLRSRGAHVCAPELSGGARP